MVEADEVARGQVLVVAGAALRQGRWVLVRAVVGIAIA